MLSIIARAKEVGLKEELVFALEDLFETALGEVAEGIFIQEDVPWETAYSRAFKIITGQSAVDVKVEHPGILEIPEGKSIKDMSLKHFQKIAKEKGRGAVSRALLNLVRWNKKKNPSLSKWARSMLDKFIEWADKNL